jgi:hypothetical protein
LKHFLRVSKKISLFYLLLILTGIVGVFAPWVNAANFTHASIRPDRMAISLANNYLVVITPATAATEASTRITFPAGYTPVAYAVTTAGIPTTYHGLTLTAMPGLGGTTVAGQDVTVPHGDLTVGTTYGFYLQDVTNPTTVGQKIIAITTQDGAAVTIDSNRVAIYIVNDNGALTDSDQVVITASVPPTFTFDLDANIETILTSLTTPVSALNVVHGTVRTNAHNGYGIWMRNANASGLASALTGTSIPKAGAPGTFSTLIGGTEGYVVGIRANTNTSGTLSISGNYDDGVSVNGGGNPVTTAYDPIAAGTAPVGGAGDVITITGKAAISATTAAANDYTDTLTLTAAADF